MGISDDNPNGKRGKGSHRKHGSTGTAQWSTVNPQLIRTAIAASTDDGGALLFGITSDKGALVVRVYGEGDPYSEYFGPHDDIESWLAGYCSDHGFTIGEGHK